MGVMRELLSMGRGWHTAAWGPRARESLFLCAMGSLNPGLLSCCITGKRKRAREDNGEKNWVSDHCAFC